MVVSLMGDNCILYRFYRIYLFWNYDCKSFYGTGIDLWFSGSLKKSESILPDKISDATTFLFFMQNSNTNLYISLWKGANGVCGSMFEMQSKQRHESCFVLPKSPTVLDT